MKKVKKLAKSYCSEDTINTLRSVFEFINPLKIIRDSNTIPHNCPNPTIFELLLRTLRYRFAGLGVPISENEKKLLEFKNIHQGQRAFIIGNGPSLNKLDLTRLKNEITFGVNAIYMNYDKMGFYPTYYVVEDVFVAEDRADEINQYRESIKFFGNYLNYCLKHDEKTIWLNVIFRYYNYIGFPHFSKNAARRIWTGGTVTYLCMQLAYYMGFEKVYLIGFDHSYSIPQSALKKGYQILSTKEDPNHFHKDYFGKGKRWHDPMVDRMENAYRKANKFYSKNRRKIGNATYGGNLSVFCRFDYNDLFED